MKIIALITMTVDHIGAFFFPDLVLLRLIGRAAWPIFALYLAEGYTQTRDPARYLQRLLMAGIIAEVPFHYLRPDAFNIMFTLALGLLAIMFMQQWYTWPGVAAVLLVAEYIGVDYGAGGVLLILIYYLIVQHTGKISYDICRLPKHFYYLYYPGHIFIIAIVSLILK